MLGRNYQCVLWIAAFASLLTAPGSLAQDDPDPQVRVDEADDFVLSWFGTAGRSFFILHSADLLDWDYVPRIDLGAGGPLELTAPLDQGFFAVRLQYTDLPTNDPVVDDFDGDWINNWLEITLFGTDPFNPATFGISDRERDINPADGVPDFMAHILGVAATPSTDTDGDGLPDAAELAADPPTNPLDPDTDHDGLPDNDDPDPLTPLTGLTGPAGPVSSLQILTPLAPETP